MTPLEFCELAMLDYERQWAAAAGHQERHPLRLKMRLLQELMQRCPDHDAFSGLLAEGCGGEDPFRALLCADLLPRWQQAHDGAPAQTGC